MTIGETEFSPPPRVPGANDREESHESFTDVEVLIIGAGFAGLACALALNDEGVSCCVLEARDRVGGRVLTHKAGGLAVEYGAEFIHGEHVTTWQYLARFGMQACGRGNPLTPGRSALDDGCVYAYADGHLYPPSHVHNEPNRLFFRPVEDAIDDWLKNGGDPDVSVGEVIRQHEKDVFPRSPPTEDERRLCHGMLAEWYAADLDEVSLQEDVQTDDILEAVRTAWGPALSANDDGVEQHWRVKAGYSELARRMAEPLRVEYRHEVFAIDWSEKERVAISAHGPKGERTFRAQRAVVALPLACLKSDDVLFTPSLPSKKQEAIDHLGAGEAFKVVISFVKPFWPKDLQFLFTPFNIQVWWPGTRNEDKAEAYFIGYVGGKTGAEILQLADGEIISEALRQLTQIFVDCEDGGQRRRLPKVVNAEVIRWPSDRWSKMGYSFMPTGCPPLARLGLWEPTGSLYWAGEACHPTRSGTVHGALESGKAAARALVQSLDISVLDLREAEQELLERVYEELLVVHFPVEGELDDLEDMRIGLQQSDDQKPELHILVARSRDGELAGCASYEFYPIGEFCLLSYLCVSPSHRKQGVARRLVRLLEAQIRTRVGDKDPVVFAETHMANVEDGIMDPRARQEALRSMGFRCLGFSYTQPPLSSHHAPCGGLRLLVKNRSELPSETVVAYLDNFAASVSESGWDASWKAQPYYMKQIEELMQSELVEATAELPW